MSERAPLHSMGASASEGARRDRVVVVGGGFAGLQAVCALRRTPVDVTLVDRQNFHLFQPLAYQVATGALSAAEVAVPLRGVLKRQANARVLLGEVTGFDLGIGPLYRPTRRTRAQAPTPLPPRPGRPVHPATESSSTGSGGRYGDAVRRDDLRLERGASRLFGSTSALTQWTSLLPFGALSPNVSTRVKFSSRWP